MSKNNIPTSQQPETIQAQQNIGTQSAPQYTAKDVTPYVKTEAKSIEDNEAKLRAMYEYDAVMVRGVFRRHDGSTDPLEFSWRKHKWEKLTKYKLFHGQVHSVPRGVALHLNEDCKTNIYGQKQNGIIVAADAKYSGDQPEVVGHINRFSFSSLDFFNEATGKEVAKNYSPSVV